MEDYTARRSCRYAQLAAHKMTLLACPNTATNRTLNGNVDSTRFNNHAARAPEPRRRDAPGPRRQPPGENPVCRVSEGSKMMCPNKPEQARFRPAPHRNTSPRMPRIDGKGNIIPDGAPMPPPELPGGASFWILLLLVGLVFCGCSVPSQAAFETHLDAVTQVMIP